MKRRIILICVLLVISIIVIGKYKNIKNEEQVNKIKESNIAIMVYDDESDSYVKQNSVPKGAKYSLNETLTKCEAGGQVTNYNKINGTLKYVLPQMDYCYVYFDVDNTPSYAIYSETDNSLIFYKNNDTVGEEYNGRVVTAKYDDVENYDFNGQTDIVWYENRNNIKTISVANEITPISTALWFATFENVESIDLTNMNTSYVTSMRSMFASAGRNPTNFTLDLGDDFDTSQVTNMRTMFQSAGRANPKFTLELGEKFDTSNVTNMHAMFNYTGYQSTNFELDLGDKFDTSKVTNMQMMFQNTYNVSSASNIDFGDKFDTSKVTDMSYMFAMAGYNSSTFQLDVSGFSTANVTTMENMFAGAGFSNSGFTLNLGNDFDTSNVTNMKNMFSGVGKANPNFELNFGNKFDTSKVTNMYRMFEKTGNLASGFELDVSSFVINSNCNLDGFATYSSAKIIFGEGWANATLVSGMFKCDSSTSIEIVNAPANIQSYDFAADNRVATFTTI